MTDLDTLSDKIYRWSKSNPNCFECDKRNDGNVFTLLMQTADQDELFLRIIKAPYKGKFVFLLTIRNLGASYDKVTKVYLKVIGDNKFRILKLKKGKNKFPSILFFNSFNRDIFYSCLSDLLNK